MIKDIRQGNKGLVRPKSLHGQKSTDSEFAPSVDFLQVCLCEPRSLKGVTVTVTVDRILEVFLKMDSSKI